MKVPYGHQSINQSDLDAVISTLRSDWLTQGPKVLEFERALAQTCGVRYAVVLANGTAALHAAYAVAGLAPGDEFITTPLTFAATANAGLYCGATPVFADVDEVGNLDPKASEKKITKKTKAVVVVDYSGHPVNLNAFKKISKKHKLILIEDAAHSLGAKYFGKSIGPQSDLTTLSFHPVKSITTGEGGAVLTNQKNYYNKLLRFRSHGIVKEKRLLSNRQAGEWYQEMQTLGYNYRLTDFQSALGLSQLKRLPKFIAARQKIAKSYQTNLKPITNLLTLPKELPGALSSWHLYVVRLKPSLTKFKKEIFSDLRKAGVGVQVHYPLVTKHPYYVKLGYGKETFPNAESWYAAAISLPIYPDLLPNEQAFVVKTLTKILKHYANK